MGGHWWKRSPSPGQKWQSNKPVHQQSFPSFLSIRNKVHSIHSNNISYQQIAQPRQSKESQYNSFHSQHQRKKEKIFTFSRNGKDQQTKNVFYQSCSPKNVQSNFAKQPSSKVNEKNSRCKSSYFASQKSKMIPVSAIE